MVTYKTVDRQYGKTTKFFNGQGDLIADMTSDGQEGFVTLHDTLELKKVGGMTPEAVCSRLEERIERLAEEARERQLRKEDSDVDED